MVKLFSAIALYAIAIASIFSGVELAGDMDWPRTSLEMTAAAMMTLGMMAKLAGHCVLLSLANAR